MHRFFIWPHMKSSLHKYIAVNMGVLLDSCLLDELPSHILREVMEGIQELQRAKQPFTRSDHFSDALLEEHASWIESQDFPTLIIPSTRMLSIRESPKLVAQPVGIPKPGKTSLSQQAVDPENGSPRYSFCDG